MTESEFNSTRKGHALVALLKEPMAIARILALSRAVWPAVEAIDSEVANTIGTLSDVEKQAAWRVMKHLLGVHVLRPVKKGQRVLGGRVFSRDTFYGEVVRPSCGCRQRRRQAMPRSWNAPPKRVQFWAPLGSIRACQPTRSMIFCANGAVSGVRHDRRSRCVGNAGVIAR